MTEPLAPKRTCSAAVAAATISRSAFVLAMSAALSTRKLHRRNDSRPQRRRVHRQRASYGGAGNEEETERDTNGAAMIGIYGREYHDGREEEEVSVIVSYQRREVVGERVRGTDERETANAYEREYECDGG